MKRINQLTVVVASVALAVISATPATAKGRPKPPPAEPDLYSVTFTPTGTGYLGSTDTACTPGAALIMRDVDGHLVADGLEGTSVPRLSFEAAIPWERSYPDPTGDASGFHGCHGAYPDPAGDASDPSYLWLYREGGSIVGMLWAFDAFQGTEVVQLNAKKFKTVDVKEYFRTGATSEVTYTTTGDATEVAGPFAVNSYSPDGIFELGTDDLAFAITIEGPLP